MNKNTRITTSRGVINFPAYVPVCSPGDGLPEGSMRSYLKLISPVIMTSYYHQQGQKQESSIPVIIDSGGFAALCPDSRIIEKNGLGILEVKSKKGETATINPQDLIEYQQAWADIAFTLDFPIPLEADLEQAQLRHRLTIANALWAIKNRRRKDMKLYACIQAWDAASARQAAEAYVDMGFDGITIGGIESRSQDLPLVKSIIQAVREVITDLPLHVSCVDTPSLILMLFVWGVNSVDSSAYVKLATEGKLYGIETEAKMAESGPLDTVRLALCNLSIARDAPLPLSAVEMAFPTINALEK